MFGAKSNNNTNFIVNEKMYLSNLELSRPWSISYTIRLNVYINIVFLYSILFALTCPFLDSLFDFTMKWSSIEFLHGFFSML